MRWFNAPPKAFNVECAEIRTDLTSRNARMVLEPYFDELQARFVEVGLTRVRKTKLHCRLGLHDTPRHFGGCLEDGSIIYAAPELVELPTDTVLGILAHELGHATDFLYPGEFLLRGDHVVRIDPDRERIKGWKRRDSDTVEVTADLIAEYVLEVPIGYRGPCHLQALGLPGKSRPIGLV
jgi:hypothetical protein